MIELKCQKCGILFEQSGIDNHGHKYIKRFCTRSCANSKTWSDEDKKKKSDSAKKSIKVLVANRLRTKENSRNCPICKTIITKQNKTYCSRKCYNMDLELAHRNGGNGGFRERCGSTKKGYYNNIFCASTYELAFLVFCLDHGADITRCFDVFEYEYLGRKHVYHPDFNIGDVIYEIKGYYTDVVDVKKKAVESCGREIHIINRVDIQPYIEYVKKRYNVSNLETLYE